MTKIREFDDAIQKLREHFGSKEIGVWFDLHDGDKPPHDNYLDKTKLNNLFDRLKAAAGTAYVHSTFLGTVGQVAGADVILSTLSALQRALMLRYDTPPLAFMKTQTRLNSLNDTEGLVELLKTYAYFLASFTKQ